jgi:hypothetical protein
MPVTKFKADYAVTFEFPVNPPVTHRGTVEGASLRTIAKKAIQEAQKAYPGLKWSSISVLLDRYKYMKKNLDDPTLMIDATP